MVHFDGGTLPQKRGEKGHDCRTWEGNCREVQGEWGVIDVGGEVWGWEPRKWSGKKPPVPSTKWQEKPPVPSTWKLGRSGSWEPTVFDHEGVWASVT